MFKKKKITFTNETLRAVAKRIPIKSLNTVMSSHPSFTRDWLEGYKAR